MQAALWDSQDDVSEDDLRALIALSLVPGVGPGRLRKLIRCFGSPSSVLRASSRQLVRIEGVGPQTASAIASFDMWADVDAQFARAEEVEARLIVEHEDEYPRLLREIYDPPPFLWVLGEGSLNSRCVAIVGTRRPTDYGRRVASEFAEGLAAAGVAVVSGMAYGIDSVAHNRALAMGGVTFGVLGSGIDVIYPSRNRPLASRIVEQRGAVLSEFPLGAKPDAPNFPRRNRIVSGLCLATIVVEAFESGGALITARIALEQNREVFAIPSPVHNAAGLGTNQLIRDGHARLATSVDDVLEEIFGTMTPRSESAPPPPDLHGLELAIYDALTDEPIHIDTLCSRCDLDPSTALVHLLGLEFKGVVRQMAGKQFVRA